jgi:type IX secretion system PorP/SprF family membrane protein
MRKLSVLTLICALIMSVCAKAQDPVFTDYSFAYSTVNPALTGTYGYLRGESVYRLQWPNLAGNYQTMIVAADAPSKYGNIGIQYLYDVAGGVLTTQRTDLNLSYPIRLWKDSTGAGKVVLQPGFQASLHMVYIDWNALTFGDMIDPRRGFVYSTNNPPGTTRRMNIDFSAGLLAYHKRFSIGIAAFHMNEPNQGFMGNSPLPMRYVLHMSGVLWNVDQSNMEAFRLVPSFYYSKQGNFEVASISASAFYKNIRGGIGYRNRDAIFFSAGYTKWNCTLTYSYDLTLFHLKGLTGGSHEIHFRFAFKENEMKIARSNMRMHY